MTQPLRALLIEAEERNPELKGHGERTASFAVATAQAMGVADHRLASLRIAAALHFAFGLCDASKQKVDLPNAPQAADFIRGMSAEWNMAALESSILSAACDHDRKNCGIAHETREYRPGVLESLHSVAELITPIDYVS